MLVQPAPVWLARWLTWLAQFSLGASRSVSDSWGKDVFSFKMKAAGFSCRTSPTSLKTEARRWRVHPPGFPSLPLLHIHLPFLPAFPADLRHQLQTRKPQSSHDGIKSNSYNKPVGVRACMRACTCVWGCFMLGNVEQLASMEKKKKPQSSTCQFPWYKYSHSDHFKLLMGER